MSWFNFKKNYLKDLFNGDFTDIHSHLLPGIDDGAKNIEESLAIADALTNVGFKQLITTPHVMSEVWKNTPEIINSTLHDTLKEFKTINCKLPVKAAAEYLIDEGFIQLAQNKELLTLKDNFVLVEISYLNAPINLLHLIFEIQIAGYIPVLAHPERYTFFHNNFDEYQKLKKAGCHFQINLLSTVGYYNEHVAKTADKLLKEGLIDFAGSDVHHSRHFTSFEKELKIKNIEPLKTAIANNSFFAY